MSGPSRVITFVITDLHRGGSPLVLAELAPALASRGMNVEVVTIAPRGEIAGLLNRGGVRVISLEARSNRDWRVVPRFADYLRLRRPAVVCSILIHANLLVALTRPFVDGNFKWVQSIHTVQEKPRWHWWVQGVIGGYADATIAPSRAVIDKMERHGPVVRPVIIPNGIDVPRFQRALPMSDPPWRVGGDVGKATVVGYLGRFDPVKRLHLLVEAMEFLPETFHLALVGYGSEEGRLRHAAAAGRGGGRIHFLGATGEPERWYKTFDVFCSPSASEGFGLTLAEAAAAGLPVVACGTEASRATVPEGLWVSADPTAKEVAVRLREAVGLGSGVDSEAVVSRYSIETMVGGYEAVFRQLVD